MGSSRELVDEAIAAHGGLDAWRTRDELVFRVSAGGLAFASKGQGGAVRGVRARVATAGQRVVFDDWPRAGVRTVLDGDGTRIERDDGAIEESRATPRWGLRWDALDLFAFGAPALWTYVSLPWILSEPQYEVEELPGRRLLVRFPAGIRAQSPVQTLHLDGEGRIARQDYTALAFGRWARGANICHEYREVVAGLTVATRRRVHPRLPGGAPLRPVELVWIALDPAT